MDETRFDDLVRRFASSTNRRNLLRSAVASVAGSIGLVSAGDTDAATRRSIGEICRKHGDCSSNRCGPADATGRCRCACSTPADCPAPTAGGQCNSATCSPSGLCGIGITVGAPCDDGDLCTVNDQCQANGTCVGTPKNCDDTNACTTNSCDPSTGNCVNTPISCNDNNACTRDTCDPVSGCAHTSISCDDGNVCTGDTCDPQSGCIHTPIECGTVSDGNGGTVCCGGCPTNAPCCDNGVCGACPACNCRFGATTITLADGSILGSNGGGVCVSPCTSNADCGCGQLCVATFELCLPDTPSVDCATSSLGTLAPGAYCAGLSICSFAT